MKKKIIYIVLAVCTILLLLGVGIVIFEYNRSSSSDSEFTTGLTAEEYLLINSNEKASEKEDAIWLIENVDTVFRVNSESFKKTMSELSQYSVDTVYIRPKVFYAPFKENADYEKFVTNLSRVVSSVKKTGKKCAVVLDSSFIREEFLPVITLGDKIVISGMQNESAAAINKISALAKKLTGEKKIKTEILLDSSFTQRDKLDFSRFDSIYLCLKNEAALTSFRQWKALMAQSNCTVTAGFILNGKAPDSALRMVYDTDKEQLITGRCYYSFKYALENMRNCFGAVHQYITGGIVPELAFRKLSIVGYDGENVPTNEASAEINVTSSNLFPFILNSSEHYTDNTGSKKITLQLDEGENVFVFNLNGESLSYKTTYTFDGELIESMFPSDVLSVSPGEEIEVMVVAYSKSEVTVKLGTQQFEAQAQEKERPCYTAFTAKIKMPSSLEELSSVGAITVVATCNGESVQKKGAVIKASEGVTFNQTTSVQQTTEKAEIDNYIPFIPEGSGMTNKVTTAPYTPPVTIKPSQGEISRKMCVVTLPYADTFRPVAGDDTFVPFFTTLTQGTMDYIVGESQAYNSEDDKMLDFYDLASGRKVKKEAVQVVETAPYKDNTMSVISCTAEKGSLNIRIKTDWKVPYDLKYSPQNYFAAYGKLYNVSSFTADTVEFTFYNTVSAQGNIDVEGSNVLSSASFNASSSDKTAKLTLKLRNAGEYYGSSISYDKNGDMIITVKNKPLSLSGAVIMLDAGHGGTEPGAVGIGSAVLEKDVNIAIAHQTKSELEKMGATVIMTRYNNETLTLDERKAIMRQYKPDLFVAIHSNGSYNTSEKGTSTYYYKPFSRNLAQNIYGELLDVYKNSVYAGRTELFGEISDGVIYYPFSVTRVEECPSVLIEVGYMTNDEECYELIDSENQKLFGKAVADGIARTISE